MVKPRDLSRPFDSRRRQAALRLLGLGLAGGLVLAACGGSPSSNKGSNNTSTTVKSKASSPVSLSGLENAAPTGKVSLTEDGSSLLWPLYQQWVKGYQKSHRSFSSTSGGDGSGTGISDAESGTTVLGASDAYLPPGTNSQYPTLENIPVAISAQMINYNLPKLSSTHLKLDGTVLAGMYEGKITNWDDPQIAKLNPSVKLPNLKVVPVHRSDSSGDSFLFSSYLADSDPASFAAKQGPSTSPNFPSVSGAVAAKGNSGMVAACKQTPGCVAYIGISYHGDTTSAGLGEAMVRNRSGNYELPSAASIHAEAAGFTTVPANGAISLIYGKAASGYPIINFEYLILKTNQSDKTTADGLKAFIAWAMDPAKGNSASYLGPVGFQPLPKSAQVVALKLLDKVS
jgi:phosphate transport system substrate-binding protein